MKIEWKDILESPPKRRWRIALQGMLIFLAVVLIYSLVLLGIWHGVHASERAPFFEMDFLDAISIRHHLATEHGYIFHPSSKTSHEALKAACTASEQGSAPIGWRQNGTGMPVAVCLTLAIPTEADAIRWCAKHKAIIMIRAEAVVTCQRSIR